MPAGASILDYSKHAADRAAEYKIDLPKFINYAKAQFIECEISCGKVEKVLVRIPYSDDSDLVLAIIPKKFFVKTCWVNKHDDHHATLNTSGYEVC